MVKYIPKLVQYLLDLLDFPNSYTGQSGKVPVVKATEDGLEFVSLVMTFLGLTDTPSSYLGQADRLVKVNSAANALEFGGFLILAVSDIEIANVNYENLIDTAGYSYKQGIRIKFGGKIRIKFDMKRGVSAQYVYGKIYINDVAVGGERKTLSTDYVTFSGDFDVNYNDLIQLYTKNDAEPPATYPGYCRNLRIYGSLVPKTLTWHL